VANKAIKVQNLSKAYQLGDFGTGTISRDLERFLARVRGKEDPFLKIGELNDRTVKGSSDIVWSLKDINFTIEQGDAVGIIGRNGAGKSTLLKILSRVTSPTTGSVKVKGRVASLLEVGTGFHAELTGRENVYLNGAILGMRKAEIKRKFDEIVDFSGVERYIDTPVKRYSSGMYVRLAFAVAAYLESEILIVDEVLAVGDAEFQKKCLGKMGDVSKGEGRTVLFVSHNMGAIEKLCTKGIMLEKGMVNTIGSADECILAYNRQGKMLKHTNYSGSGIIKEIHINVDLNKNSKKSTLTLQVTINTDTIINDVVLGLVIKNLYDVPIIGINNRHFVEYDSKFKNIRSGVFNISLPDLLLLPGEYTVDVYLGNRIVDIEIVQDALIFDIEDINTAASFPIDYRLNKMVVEKAKWEFSYD
jgi:lipopolysaccharide transport system ATP-binding protein